MSVCLCTFNGEQYLDEQLRSIARQDLPPDEIVIGDDGSTDATLDIARAFAASVSFDVRITERAGATPLGPAANLAATLPHASADVICLADQDDVWMPHKISSLAEALDSHPDAGGAFADSKLIDGGGRPLPGSLWAIHGFTERAQARVSAGRGIVDIALKNVVATHAVALRRRSLSLVLPFPAVSHGDWWMALLLAGSDGMIPLTDPLVAYRQHGSNAVGVHVRHGAAGRLMPAPDGPARVSALEDRASMVEQAVVRLRERRPGAISDEDAALLDDYVRYLRVRDSLPRERGRRVLPVLRELATGRYRRYGHDWRRAALDLVREGGAAR